MKKTVSVILVFLSVFLLCSCSVKSPEEYYAADESAGTELVAVKVDCVTALPDLRPEISEKIPYNGIIANKAVGYEEGDTAFTVLTKALKQDKIQLEYSGEGESVYVEGISHLYQFDCGDLSGWMFSVNGVFGETGANSTKVNPGDLVEWRYTCDLGDDIGASYKDE